MFLTFPLHDVDQTSKSLQRREVDGAGEVTQQVEMLGPQDWQPGFDPQDTRGRRELTPTRGPRILTSVLRREPRHTAHMHRQIMVGRKGS